MRANYKSSIEDLNVHQFMRREEIEARAKARAAKEDAEAFLDIVARLVILGMIFTAILLAIWLPIHH